MPEFHVEISYLDKPKEIKKVEQTDNLFALTYVMNSVSLEEKHNVIGFRLVYIQPEEKKPLPFEVPFEIKEVTVTNDDKEYEVLALDEPFNISENNETEFPTVATHVIKGFDEDILVVIEKKNDDEFDISYATFVGETRLLTPIDDENEVIEINGVLFHALNNDDLEFSE